MGTSESRLLPTVVHASSKQARVWRGRRASGSQRTLCCFNGSIRTSGKVVEMRAWAPHREDPLNDLGDAETGRATSQRQGCWQPGHASGGGWPAPCPRRAQHPGPLRLPGPVLRETGSRARAEGAAPPNSRIENLPGLSGVCSLDLLRGEAARGPPLSPWGPGNGTGERKGPFLSSAHRHHASQPWQPTKASSACCDGLRNPCLELLSPCLVTSTEGLDRRLI